MDIEKATLVLTALSQSSRLEAFRLLVRHEPHGLPAGQIADHLGVPQNTMSSHLSVLSRAGLTKSQRRSRLIIYRADLAALREVLLFLAKDCCDGKPELCGPLITSLASCSRQSEGV
ncbi:transcriptional regulator [Notoacmeibacter marinus]|uniref:Transcriptional regulator n=1 Tax=Notoacmeibacter marinus TaxID=1876515 RepID=A0A231V2L7_9HYPH|nr:metalloregulator ArsR/SmtB family transcription factor [Notoacmeibacter marinus]OXT02390.1 transcriptional regulator [Notoacmeibacter marinus]